MIKYLADSAGRLKGQKKGMEGDPSLWLNYPETVTKVQERIDLLESKEGEIEDLKEKLAAKQIEAHKLSDECEEYADRLEAATISLVGTSPEKLIPYGIKLRKAAEKKAIPTKVLHPVLQDDTDGVGFVISFTSDPDAVTYECMKGFGTDASKPDAVPELKLFNVTTKSSFVDDDVPKGVRVFYKVRSVNASGAGPWSEAVSRVQ